MTKQPTMTKKVTIMEKNFTSSSDNCEVEEGQGSNLINTIKDGKENPVNLGERKGARRKSI